MISQKQCCADRDRLQARVEELEEALGCTAILDNVHPGISPTMQRLLGLLFTRDVVSKETFHLLIYAGRNECDWPDTENLLSVYACKLRKKLKPLGVEIKNAWGRGYYLTAEHKKKLAEAFDLRSPAEQDTSPAVPPQEKPADEVKPENKVTPENEADGPRLPAWLPPEYVGLYHILKKKLGRGGEIRRVIEDQIMHDGRKAARANVRVP